MSNDKEDADMDIIYQAWRAAGIDVLGADWGAFANTIRALQEENAKLRVGKEDVELTDAEIDFIANEWVYEPKQARRAGDGTLVEYSCFTAGRLRHFVRAAIRAFNAKKEPTHEQ